MYSIYSKKYTQEKKDHIREFSKSFVPRITFPADKFTHWHYPLIAKNRASYYYKKRSLF